MDIQTIKKHAFDILENQSTSRVGKYIERFLLFTIIVSVISMVLETVGSLSHYSQIFFWIEAISVGIFTIEYIARIWTTDFRKYYKGWKGKLLFTVTPLMIFDLLVILPFFLELIFPKEILHTGLLRFFRLIRILRIMRIGRYSTTLDRIVSLIQRHKPDLVAIFFLIIVIVSILSTAMYFIENPAQPDKFSSIPASIWWGIITISTIGYGDMTPITTMGKLLGTITALFGVAIFALPTAILGASFYAEIISQEKKRIEELEKEVKKLKSITSGRLKKRKPV